MKTEIDIDAYPYIDTESCPYDKQKDNHTGCLTFTHYSDEDKAHISIMVFKDYKWLELKVSVDIYELQQAVNNLG